MADEVTGEGLDGDELHSFRSHQLLRFKNHLEAIKSPEGEVRSLIQRIESSLDKAKKLASAYKEYPNKTPFPSSWRPEKPGQFKS
ncbi:hypothetical protein ColTof4_14375 [Colletotrichum tofieldiae]|nr:hypothetical protein ColTof3_14786 [Colletotrichum tofieldiae]GKT81952.1 hypothetical protein ColTof4_14375 [Colletotrichum tofieldiae]